jgi:hypothetical protein
MGGRSQTSQAKTTETGHVPCHLYKFTEAQDVPRPLSFGIGKDPGPTSTKPRGGNAGANAGPCPQNRSRGEPMPPVREISADHASAVLARGCIDVMGLPRLCAARQCRRHRHCIDPADSAPRCATALPADAFDHLVRLYRLVRDILDDRYPPKPSTDPAACWLECQAISVMYGCLDALPGYQSRVSAWHQKYAAPPASPAPPAPKIDTGKLIAEMKAEVERYKMIDETRAATEALRQRIAAHSDGRA